MTKREPKPAGPVKWKMVDGYTIVQMLPSPHGGRSQRDEVQFGVFVGCDANGAWWVGYSQESWRHEGSLWGVTGHGDPFADEAGAVERSRAFAAECEMLTDRSWVADVLAILAREDKIDAATAAVKWTVGRSREALAATCDVMAERVRQGGTTDILREMAEDAFESKIEWISRLIEAGCSDAEVERLVLGVEAACAIRAQAVRS